MSRVDSEFKNKVLLIVASIPRGKVMTYGQIAVLAGAAWAAWEVGQIAHFGPSDLPWQRVVNKNGGLAKGYTPGGLESHKRDLEKEGVAVSEEFTVDLEKILWKPASKSQSSLL
jgi:methylated-DNA-protein-cysteine methyltransferase-like protein